MIIPVPFAKLKGMSDSELVEAYEKNLGFDHETAVAYTTQLRGHAIVEKAMLPSRMFMTVESALELASSVGHEPLVAELTKSAEAGVGFVNLGETDDGVEVSAPKGVHVGMMFSKRLDAPGAVMDPHVVLVTVNELDTAQTRQLVSTVAEVAKRHGEMRAAVKLAAHSPVTGAWIASVTAPGLASLRSDLFKSLTAVGISVVSDADADVAVLGYSEEEPEGELSFDTELGALTTAVGSFRYDHEFGKSEGIETDGLPIVKSNEEQRFTLAPMYIPGEYDSQGDWAESDDLQKAVWNFQRGDKLIALQHHPEAGPMGEAVEMMVIPWEHTVPMFKADGTSYERTFPAGTPWLGVIWSEEVWPLVKAGKVRGYSIGGRASLLNVELPEAV